MGNLYSRMGYMPLPGRDPSARDRLQNLENRLTAVEAFFDKVDDRLADVENLKIIQQQMIQESMELRRNLEMPMGNFFRQSSLVLSKRHAPTTSRYKASIIPKNREQFFDCADEPKSLIENLKNIQNQLIEDSIELRKHLKLPVKQYTTDHPLFSSDCATSTYKTPMSPIHDESDPLSSI